MESHETTTRTNVSDRSAPKRLQLRLLLAGIACMVGGEAFCLFGPFSDTRLVHVACHVVFYTGVVLCVGAAVLHWGVKSGNVR